MCTTTTPSLGTSGCAMGVMVAVGRCGDRGEVTLCELFTTVNVARVSRPGVDDDTCKNDASFSFINFKISIYKNII